MTVGSLKFESILNHPELVSSSVFQRAQQMSQLEVLVAEIDPQYMGGKELCDHYGVNPSEGANCVIVEASHGDVLEYVAVVVPVGYRADLNGLVKKQLKAKRVSLAPLDQVLAKTGMEYGSITPFGLPESWRILIDSRLMEKERIIVGGGKAISKLSLPREAFLQFGILVIDGLSVPHPAL